MDSEKAAVINEIMERLEKLDLKTLQAVEREVDNLLAERQEESHEVVCPDVADRDAAVGSAALDGSGA